MSDELVFGAEPPLAQHSRRPWTLLIVDDEREVHAVTTLALRDFMFAGRGLHFLHAYSGAEAKQLLAQTADVALVLLDVVMETDHAGLDVVEHVRNVLHNRFIRIVLRTGQPGQAPEPDVITRHDINDYKQKTELTRERLYTTVYTGLSVYRDLMALDASRRGLQKVIESSARIFELRSMEQFAQGVLEQLSALLFLERDAVVVQASGVAMRGEDSRFNIIAGTGSYSASVGMAAETALPEQVLRRIHQVSLDCGMAYGEDYFVGCHSSAQPAQERTVFYVGTDGAEGGMSLADRTLIELFCRNVSIARDNLRLFATRPPE